MDDFQHRLTYMLRRTSAAIGHQVNRALGEFDLTGTQLGALSHLVLVSPEGLSSAELAHRVGVTPQSMSSAVADLLARGLLERRPHPTHGRILEIRVTPEGTALRERAQTAMDELNARLVEPLDRRQRTQLLRGLAELMDSLELTVGSERPR